MLDLLLFVPVMIGLTIFFMGGIYLGLLAIEWLLDRVGKRYDLVREFFVFVYRRTKDRAARPPVHLDDRRVLLATLVRCACWAQDLDDSEKALRDEAVKIAETLLERKKLWG